MKQAFMKTGQAILTVTAFSLLTATAVQAAESDTAPQHEKTTTMQQKTKGHHPAVVTHRKHHPHPLMKRQHHPMHPMHPMKPEAPAH